MLRRPRSSIVLPHFYYLPIPLVADIVLIPGAWMGAWAWDEVADRLRDLGHRPHPLTLSGLNHNDDASDVSLETHVDDVIDLAESQDLRDAIVVGHSYSGIVAGLVAHRLPERVAHAVYAAAFLPRDGESLVDVFPEEQSREERRQIEEHDGMWPPPDERGLSQEKDLAEPQRKRLADQFVMHPGRTVTEPVAFGGSLAEQSATYIVCVLEQGESPATVADVEDEPSWTIRRIAAGHFPMASAPNELAEAISLSASDVASLQ